MLALILVPMLVPAHLQVAHFVRKSFFSRVSEETIAGHGDTDGTAYKSEAERAPPGAGGERIAEQGDSGHCESEAKRAPSRVSGEGIAEHSDGVDGKSETERVPSGVSGEEMAEHGDGFAGESETEQRWLLQQHTIECGCCFDSYPLVCWRPYYFDEYWYLTLRLGQDGAVSRSASILQELHIFLRIYPLERAQS
jgi:hypothetical protein